MAASLLLISRGVAPAMFNSYGSRRGNDLVMTRTPAGRWGEPEDIGNAALFLASKASQFVNGQVLYVDGGILANFGYVKGENEI